MKMDSHTPIDIINQNHIIGRKTFILPRTFADLTNVALHDFTRMRSLEIVLLMACVFTRFEFVNRNRI